MIPIRDTISTRNYPVVNNTIIGINVVVFLLQLMQGPELDRFIYIYGLVPARYSVDQIAAYFTLGQQLFSMISFMFLHGGFLHLIGNVWFLYIFGDNVEDRLGHLRYIGFYLLCGLASGISHLLLNLNSNIPTIGASGAIAGVMGAYFILHPRSKILTLIPIIIIPWLIEIPAFFFLGFWFVLQFINAAASHGDVSGIAWWAHIGGFVFGIIFLKLFLLFPSIGVTERMRPVTTKRKTHRLQVIRPVAPGNEANLYGTIVISPFEALTGTRKMVNIPWGFHKKLIRVSIPSGIKEDTKLRLKGLGSLTSGGQKGDLFLKVVIKS
jgi:membrane associated rhomboid family serine protease